ncbi:unnamed protein product [Allacma fusca]|uniref:Uncharacterized protein n=1 Tax=Allacma fusca TaxID=39272 RepID=A0A8J2LEZ4_9HEXA|nr:unnamed protein product [Allacma fusca]
MGNQGHRGRLGETAYLNCQSLKVNNSRSNFPEIFGGMLIFRSGNSQSLKGKSLQKKSSNTVYSCDWRGTYVSSTSMAEMLTTHSTLRGQVIFPRKRTTHFRIAKAHFNLQYFLNSAIVFKRSSSCNITGRSTGEDDCKIDDIAKRYSGTTTKQLIKLNGSPVLFNAQITVLLFSYRHRFRC